MSASILRRTPTIVVALSALLLASCGGSDDASSPSTNAPPASEGTLSTAGTLTEIDFREAIGDLQVLQSDLNPWDCFLSFETGFDLVTLADCDDSGVEMEPSMSGPVTAGERRSSRAPTRHAHALRTTTFRRSTVTSRTERSSPR